MTAISSPPKRAPVNRDCGPEGCAIDWLSSKRHEVDLDIAAFTGFSLKEGWGDGLPVVPPTETRVREFIAAGNRYPDEVVCVLPPMDAECTIEKVAINAVMAGAPPASMPLLMAA